MNIKKTTVIERVKCIDECVYYKDVDDSYYEATTIEDTEQRFGLKLDGRKKYLITGDNIYVRRYAFDRLIIESEKLNA